MIGVYGYGIGMFRLPFAHILHSIEYRYDEYYDVAYTTYVYIHFLLTKRIYNMIPNVSWRTFFFFSSIFFLPFTLIAGVDDGYISLIAICSPSYADG